MSAEVPIIKHLFISPGHNFYGRAGKEANAYPTQPCPEIECEQGSGIVGDRFFNYKPDYIGQITFFEMETYRDIQQQFSVPDLFPSAFRRNVLTEGVDLNALIGQEFEMQGVRFYGTEEARPCDWMNQAVAEGTKAAMKNRGGLRARILSDGTLREGPCELQVLAAA